jgi:hypothetical protein
MGFHPLHYSTLRIAFSWHSEKNNSVMAAANSDIPVALAKA